MERIDQWWKGNIGVEEGEVQKLLDVRLQSSIVQHGEYSQYPGLTKWNVRQKLYKNFIK